MEMSGEFHAPNALSLWTPLFPTYPMGYMDVVVEKTHLTLQGIECHSCSP
jgi:hypothetical protein